MAVASVALNVVQYVESRRAKGPHIKVKFYPTHLDIDEWHDNTIKMNERGELPPNCLEIEATNHGRVAVYLSEYAIRVPDGRDMTLADVPQTGKLPGVLSPGESFSTFVHLHELGQMLDYRGVRGRVVLVGIYKDQLGREYRSKPIEYDVEARVATI